MLKDPEFNNIFERPQKLHEGVFISFGFNYEHTLAGLTYEQHYPRLWESYPNFPYQSYGVCDCFEQILEKYEPLVIDPNRDYTIGLTKVVKKDQESWGGWRWHKWGEYIGVQQPTAEYLYDEPVIEEVYVFSILLLEERV